MSLPRTLRAAGAVGTAALLSATLGLAAGHVHAPHPAPASATLGSATLGLTPHHMTSGSATLG